MFGLTCIAQAQTGKLTFFRPAGYWGRLAKITVYCDPKEIGNLSDRTKVSVALPAETHQCFHKKDPSQETRPLVFTLSSHEERFIQVRWDGPYSMVDPGTPGRAAGIMSKVKGSGWTWDAIRVHF